MPVDWTAEKAIIASNGIPLVMFTHDITNVKKKIKDAADKNRLKTLRVNKALCEHLRHFRDTEGAT